MSKKKSNFFKFASAPYVKWSKFNKTYDNVLTSEFFNLNPIGWDVLPPGARREISISSFCRCQAFAAPIYSKIKLKTRVFAVPVRKCIPDFETIATSMPSDNLTEPYTTIGDLFMLVTQNPTFSGLLAGPGSLADYLGFPDMIDQMYRVYCAYSLNTYSPTATWPQKFQVILSEYQNQQPGDNYNTYIVPIMDTKIRLLPFIAYQKVFHDWFTDLRFAPDFSEALYDEMDVSNLVYIRYTDTFPVTFNGVTSNVNILQFLFTRRPVLYGKDYFTTCSDGQQAGPQLALMADKLDLYADMPQGAGPVGWTWQVVPSNPSMFNGQIPNDTKVKLYAGAKEWNNVGVGLPGVGEVYAQVNQADLLTPTKLRWQMALQRYQERANIGGHRRYTDMVLGQYGVRVPDPFLQRSLYIGGNSVDVETSEVIATADGTTDGGKDKTYLGEYAGRGIMRGKTPYMRISVAEHMVIIAMDCVIPQTYYTQGLPRKCTNLTLLDWPTPVFAHVGEEPVLKKEVFLGSDPDGIFGYQTRYGSYKFAFDEVHGDFKTTLKYWRTGREFAAGFPVTEPTLGFDFLEPKRTDGNDRIFTVTQEGAQPFRIFHRLSIVDTLPLPRTIENGRIG